MGENNLKKPLHHQPQFFISMFHRKLCSTELCIGEKLPDALMIILIPSEAGSTPSKMRHDLLSIITRKRELFLKSPLMLPKDLLTKFLLNAANFSINYKTCKIAKKKNPGEFKKKKKKKKKKS